MRGGAGIARSFEIDATAVPSQNGPDAVCHAHQATGAAARHFGSDCGPLGGRGHGNQAVRTKIFRIKSSADTSDRKEGHR